MIKWHKPALMPVLYFGFCPDKATWDANAAQVLKKTHRDLQDYPSTNGCLTCWKDELGNSRLLVTIHEENDRDPIRLVGVIVHECVHIAQLTFTEAMEDTPGMEAEAYMVQSITETIWTDYVTSRGVPKP